MAEADPYELEAMIELLRKAGKHTRARKGGMAVVVAKRPCLMDRSQPETWTRKQVTITEKCKGCGLCVKTFECPALQLREETTHPHRSGPLFRVRGVRFGLPAWGNKW